MADHARTKTRKDRIMEAALRIFAEKSFQEATISEISKEAGVSEATIYEYFGTKEDLLFAIPEKISNETFEESEAALEFIKGAEARIRAQMFSYMRLYQNNPHYSALVLLQLMSNKRFRQTAAHAAIRRSAHRVLDCVRDGIADGTFRQDANPYLVRSMLMGTVEHLFNHWHMQGMPKRDQSLLDLLDPFLEMVFSGIRAKKEDAQVTVRLKLEDAKLLGRIFQNQQNHQNAQTAKKSKSIKTISTKGEQS
jgi:TetR/AcrR family fatty acid metabolism transcriptional regulator